MKRARKKTDQKIRKEIILEAARKIFILKGYKGTSIREIAQKAGLDSSGTLYLYFKTKDEIYGAVCEQILKEHMTQLQNIDLSKGTLMQKLMKITNGYIETGSKPDSKLLDINLSELELPKYIKDEMKKHDDIWYNSLNIIIKEQIETGNFNATMADSKNITIGLYALMEGIASYQRFGYFDEMKISLNKFIKKNLLWFVRGLQLREIDA